MSIFTRTLAFLVICSVSTVAQFYPNNARMDALGETFVIKDRSDIIRYAAYMNDYKNDVMVNFKGDPILGVKSLGDNFNLGVIANRGLMLQGSSFYTDAVTALGNTVNPNQYIPHVLFGFNAGSFSMGLDFFFELSHASIHSETTITGAPTTVTDASRTLLNPGAIFSAKFGTEQVPVALKLGFGVPTIRGTNDVTGSPSVKIESDKGLFLDGGAEIRFPLGPVEGTGGADMLLEKYQFKGNVNDYTGLRTAGYFGVSSKVFSDGVVGLMYDFQFLRRGVDSGTPKNSNDTLRQIISAGVENNFSQVWIFDKVAARGGLAYTYDIPLAFAKTANTDARTKSASKYGPLAPTVGLGVTKGPFQLDMSINLAAWGNLVNGPGVGQITASLDF